MLIEDASDGDLLRTLPRIAVKQRDFGAALGLLREKIGGAFATLVDPRVASLVDPSAPAPSLAAHGHSALAKQIAERSMSVLTPTSDIRNLEPADMILRVSFLHDLERWADANAQMHAIRGEKAQAVESLRRVPALHFGVDSKIHADPDFHALANYPPLRALLAPRG